MLKELFNEYDNKSINSLFKYPSILTYHKLDKKGKKAINELNSDINMCGPFWVTEKIDGSNIRIIITNDEYIIGTREKLVFFSYKENLLSNDIRPLIDYLNSNYIDNISKLQSLDLSGKILVIYGELFGSKITNSRYTDKILNKYGYMIFDAYMIDIDEIKNILSMDIQKIVYWRDHHKKWYNNNQLQALSNLSGFKIVPLRNKVDNLPLNKDDTYKWLTNYKDSMVSLIDKSSNAEGVVVRNFDRSYIRKIRIEEYI